MVVKQSLQFLLLILFLLFQSSPVWAKVSASTSRTVISIDETLVLEIKSEDSSGEPDLSVLENDFQILGRSQSQNYSLINGHASRTHSWNVTLLPKKTGEITIPAVQVGNETTQPIHLVIQGQSKTPGLDGKDVFLKVELTDTDKKDYYVQQQIVVKVKFFHRIRFANASLSEFKLDNTVVEKIGNDRKYSKVIAKHRYNVIERHYAIYPQQSGALTIPAMTFTGNAEISQNFSLFSRPGQQIISRSKPLELNILPIPDNYTGLNWLPSESLVIESEILEDINSIESGEAITRHIVVRATGLLGSQLPVINVPSSRKIKTYPDKEQLNTQILDDKMIGIRRDTIAVIPLNPGPFTLPEIKVDWWNTITNQQETAILPARTLFAQKNSELNYSTIEPDTASVDNISSTQQNADKSTEKNTIEKVIYKEMHAGNNPWFWASLAFLILWLMTLGLLYVSFSKNKRSNANPSTQGKNHQKHTTHQKHLQILYDCCHENNAHKATTALIQWTKIYFNQPIISGLSQVIDLIDPIRDQDLIMAISQLESSQYSANKQSWNGKPLSSAISQFIEHEKAQQERDRQGASRDFVPLNP